MLLYRSLSHLRRRALNQSHPSAVHAEAADWPGQRSEGRGLCVQLKAELHDALRLALSELFLRSVERH